VGQWRLLAPVATSAIASSLPSARCNQCSVYVPSADRVGAFALCSSLFALLSFFCLRFRSSCGRVFSFTTALLAHQVYVFGGNEGVWQFLPLNDLWAFGVGTALCFA
jgi:hypothetical protein